MAATAHTLPLSATPAARRERLRSIIGGSAGNVIEWYDFLAYSIFSIYFSKAFFPGGNQTAQLLNAAAVAAIGYVVRPLGSWAIGALADRHGRRMALSVSVAMMSVGSLIIALTPTYASIGVAAPAVLVCARLLQGFSMGGEAGHERDLFERNGADRPARLLCRLRSGDGSDGSTAGARADARAATARVDAHATRTVGLAHSICDRRRAGRLRALSAARHRGDRRIRARGGANAGTRTQTERGSLLVLLIQHRRQTLWTIGISIGGTVAFYTFTIYLQKFMVNTTGFSRNTATLIATVALVIYMGCQPLFGLLSDLIGRRPVMMIFGVGGTFLTVPLMHALGATHSALTAFALNLAALGILSGFSSIHWLVKSELFPARVRALGVGLPFAIVSSVMGGTTEYLALRFKHAGHESWFFYYVSACAAVSLLTYVLMPETRHRSVIDEEARQ